jgi:DNA segregation ATPase FtsK/SpoIIIE-like protein
MGGTRVRPSLASYRDAVTELFRAGEPFGDIEIAIDEVADLSMDEKATLWLFAFSLRDQSEQQREARAHLAALQ